MNLISCFLNSAIFFESFSTQSCPSIVSSPRGKYKKVVNGIFKTPSSRYFKSFNMSEIG